MLTCLVPVLFTFYIQGVLQLKKNNSGAKGLILQVDRKISANIMYRSMLFRAELCVCYGWIFIKSLLYLIFMAVPLIVFHNFSILKKAL